MGPPTHQHPFIPSFRFAALLVAATVAVLGVLAEGPSQAFPAGTRDAANQFHRGPAPHVTLLFVTSAGSGTLQPKAGSTTTYGLTLQGVDPNMVWFTDRPVRRAGSIPNNGFIQDWSRYGFEKDPPNVALVLHSAHPGHDTAVGVLSSVTFDPTSDRLEADFTVYNGQRLKSVKGDLADKARRAAGATLPGNFGDASLFIDDAWDPTAWNLTINSVYFPTTATTTVAQTLTGTSGNPMTFTSGSYVFGAINGTLAGSTFAGDVTLATPSLSGVNLSEMSESQTNPGTELFDVMDVTNADFQGTDLPQAYFLAGANLDGADLQGATFAPGQSVITDADTTCTNGEPGPCNGPNLTSG